MRRFLGGLAGLVLSACTPAVTADPTGALAGSLEVELASDTAWLTLHVTSATGGPVLLEYATAQRYDFEVRTPTGERLWQWSADQMFAQVVSEERLEADGSLRHRVWWKAPGPGEYVAVGRLAARNEPLELSATFRVPGQPVPAP